MNDYDDPRWICAFCVPIGHCGPGQPHVAFCGLKFYAGELTESAARRKFEYGEDPACYSPLELVYGDRWYAVVPDPPKPRKMRNRLFVKREEWE